MAVAAEAAGPILEEISARESGDDQKLLILIYAYWGGLLVLRAGFATPS